MKYCKILGIPFFQGTADEAVRLSESGGLAVFPAAPALKEIATDAAYRKALLGADLVLPDSAYMVIAWNLLERTRIHRISGLAYFRELMKLASFRRSGNTLWILPDSESVKSTLKWLKTQGVEVPCTHVYVAPMYNITDVDEVVDATLLGLIEHLRPQHIVLTLGGGTQEPLGYNLKERLGYKPAIHCVGASAAFLTGEQVSIPVWADRFYLGWLLRTLDRPDRFSSRYWDARQLFPLLRKWRDRLPPLTQNQG